MSILYIFLLFIKDIKYYIYIKLVVYVSWVPNQNIRMISKGSCDTEDRSNDAETFCITWINYILQYIKIEKLWNCYSISQYFFSLYFNAHFWLNNQRIMNLFIQK